VREAAVTTPCILQHFPPGEGNWKEFALHEEDEHVPALIRIPAI
jgi:hypothetical protein